MSSEQNGLAGYLSTNNDEAALRVIRSELVVLRDYASQRYQLARNTTDPCSVDEEPKTLAEIQDQIAGRVYSATYPPSDSSEWCTVPAGNLLQAERLALFQYLGLLGLKGVAISASDDQTTVTVADPCADAQRIIAAVLRHKREWTVH